MSLDSKALNRVLWFLNGLAAIVLFNVVASFYFFRWDLTEEKRYTIKEPTKDLLHGLEENVYIEVFLEGDLNSGFKRLQRSVRDLLEEFRVLSHNRIQYTFSNPASARSRKAQNEFMQELAQKGVDPINIIDHTNGERTEKIIFPGALVSYNGVEKGVMLLKGNRAQKSEEVLNQSIEGLEFEFANTIYQLTNIKRKKIALLVGHGELDSLRLASFNNALWNQYDVFKVDLNSRPVIKDYDALIIAKPTKPFTELEKWKLDRYVTTGGKLLMLLDPMSTTIDSASRNDYYSLPYPLNLDDLLFKYGARVNLDLIQDKLAAIRPVVTGMINHKPQFTNIPWPFFPLVSTYADHVITRNLDASLLQFASSIDTVKAVGIKKTPLLFSSPMARKLGAPVKVSVADLRHEPPSNKFKNGPFVLGYLLEGVFTSLYKNRILPEGAEATAVSTKNTPGKIVIFSDGDIAKNSVNIKTGKPQQLGYDPVTRYTFANQNLLLNTVAYLTNEQGLIRARSKKIKIRPLNKRKLMEDKIFWQSINILLPLAIIWIYGIIRFYIRRRKYTNF